MIIVVLQLTVTSETLDGETQLLTADDGDQRMNELLSFCEAWLPDDSDDEIDLFTPVSACIQSLLSLITFTLLPLLFGAYCCYQNPRTFKHLPSVPHPL